MNNSKLKYIIVQAGGEGTRLKHLTRNKPKAIVSINNLPILFHLFKKFPDAHFIIRGDYKCDAMTKYLAAFADADYEVVKVTGIPGTCAGLSKCLEKVPDNTPFMLIWCDLILSQGFDVDNLDIEHLNFVGLSQDFVCRWKYENGVFAEEPSQEYGVAGLFLFTDKSRLASVPESGEFVRWLSTQDMPLATVGLHGGNEYGLLKVVESLDKPKCRPFNSLKIEGDRVIKEAIDEQGKKLAERERNWYKVVADKKFKNLPKIYSLEPLTMSKVNGGPIYSYPDLSLGEKQKILTKIVKCLQDLHNLGSVPADKASYDDNYITKTLTRLEKVKDLVPFASDRVVKINGKDCLNVFYCMDKIKEQMDKYYPDKFVFLHGDSTFSNILLDENKEPVLIDPRGYFGKTELYGDVAYDWAKLYYSLYTNYDQFNLKNFDLTIGEKDVQLSIPSNNWEMLKDYYLDLISNDVCEEQLNLILALIWLSLTTYAWDDYDSICGAFYEGLLLLNECDFVKEQI